MLDALKIRLASSRAHNRLAFLTAVVLVIALAHELASITWLLWPQPKANHAPPPSISTSVPEPTVTLTALADQHLFGRATERQAPPKRFTHVPETRLDLELHGVLYSPQWAWAIIAADGGSDHLYQEGDELPGGAAVAAIYPNRVILLRGGHHESLQLPRKQLQSVQRPGSAIPRAVANNANKLGEYRERIISRPTSLAKYLRISPVREGGNLAGFRVWPKSNPALFEAVGLRPGDLVTAVGGIPLTSRRAALRALKRLRTADRVTLAVSRDGRREIIVLDFG